MQHTNLDALEKDIFGTARLEWSDSPVSETEDLTVAASICAAKSAVQRGLAIREAA
jgi:hypothetical protein